MTEIEIQTSLLYGIFTGTKSFLIGTRFLVNRTHVESLVNKILHERLPQELIDLVGDELHQLNQAEIVAKWAAGPRFDTADHTFYDFLSTPATRHGARPPRYPAERQVLKKVQEHANVNALWITASRPGAKPDGESYDHKAYLHLSALKAPDKPSLAWSLPPSAGFASFATTGAVYIGRKGRTSAGLNPGHNTSHNIAIDAAVYHRDPAHDARKRRRGLPETQAARLLQCENVTEAIQGWDAETVKAYVDLLGLKVVPFEEGNPMKPGLHIWQRIFDCIDT
ncbi:uncharacterized protein CLAFUR5_13802 [Fulvia fulva]|uniref:Uncharacterized protein n=1 Tax=Passalora fulva TaxID=5499 RepID=A0A9Q8PLT6_PASFU|nr:uncharacterized protein CLAFUR5_13802 [Fulvia fulva]UJO24785.1 hypothetical protein CLAFUR5_13802 [Fulvia fulva]WPV37094.1 hypothetical protein CLAFUW7_13970 [Fulvia fulva]